MRGVQHGWVGEERYFWVGAVDEDMMARRIEDVGVPPYRKEMSFMSLGGEKGRDGLEEASIVKNSRVKENLGRS
jgi:hypothetical protein